MKAAPLAVLAAGLLAAAPLAADQGSARDHEERPQGRSLTGELTASHVRGSVHMLVMEAAGNVGVSAGPDGIFVIDDQFAPMVPKIRAALADISGEPVRYVLNTHWHGDHTGGNEAFGRDGVVIVAHDNVRRRMSTEQFTSFFNSRTPPSPPEALPVITFSHQMTFHFNDDVVRVVHLPKAHTDGDAVFYFEKADVMHTGDVFVLYGFPFVDVSGGGSVAGMINALEQILEHIGPDTLVIPGHGPLANRERMEAFHAMLKGARERVVALMAEGKSADEIVAARPLADYEPEWGGGFVGTDRFVRIVVDSEKAVPADSLPPRHRH